MSLQARCPHCQHPNMVEEGTPLHSVDCQSCGSQFNLIGDHTMSFAAVERRTVGHFELITPVGAGAFGTVWKARDTQLDRIVAMKIPLKGQLSAKEADTFLREARAGAQLQHPHIVRVHEVGREGETVYIVSDFVEGVTLASWLTGKSATPREAAAMCAKIAEAMHHAHRAGVIHRDLKPSNIMLTNSGEPRVMDFGLAKRDAGEQTMTVEGKVMGTPAYMAPEQARGDSHIADPRTDIYSLGVILYELLTGTKPFRGNAQMMIHQVIHEEPVSPRRVKSSVPRDLDTICLKCLEKDPARRFSTAQELADELNCYLRGEPILSRPISRPERLWRWCKRYPEVASLGTIVILVLTAGVVASTWLALVARQRADAETAAKNRAIDEERRATNLADERNQTILALRDYAFSADMRAVQDTVDRGDTSHALTLLDRYPSNPGSVDDRGFVWHYLKYCCRDTHGPLVEGIARPEALALTPDGQWLAHTGIFDGGDGLVGVCDARTGAERWSIRLEKLFPSDLAMAPSGRLFAVAGASGRRAPEGYQLHGVFLGDPTAEKPTLTPLDPKATIGRCVAFSPDSTMLACGAPNGAIELWDVRDRKQIGTLTGHRQDVDRLLFLADGKQLVSASAGETVRRWDLAKRTQLDVFESTPGLIAAYDTYYRNSFWRCRPCALAQSHDGRRLASVINGRVIRIRDLESKELAAEFTDHGDTITGLAFIGDGRQLVTTSVDRDVRVTDLATGANRRLGSHQRVVNAVVVAPDGVISGGDDAVIRRWKTPDPNESPESMIGGRAFIMALAFSPQGNHVAATGWQYQIGIRDVATGTLVNTLKGYRGRVHTMAYSPDGSQILTANTDEQSLDVWDLKEQKRVRQLKVDGTPRDLAVAPDQKRVALDDVIGNRTHILELATGSRVSTLDGVEPRYSPDGRILFLQHNRELLLFDAATLKPAARIEAASEQLNRFPTFSRGGRLLACKDTNKTVLVIDVEGRTVLHRMSGILAGVTALAFSADGRTLAMGEDRDLTLWDMVTGQRLATLQGHTAEIKALAFSPDGRVLASTGLDLRIRLWRAPTLPDARPSESEANTIRRAQNFSRSAAIKDRP